MDFSHPTILSVPRFSEQALGQLDQIRNFGVRDVLSGTPGRKAGYLLKRLLAELAVLDLSLDKSAEIRIHFVPLAEIIHVPGRANRTPTPGGAEEAIG